jgi:hypothetical protein
LRIQVGQDSLITLLFQALRRFLIHQAATSPPPPVFLIFAAPVHLAFGGLDAQRRRGVDSFGECYAAGACVL